jgi:hypothetical protein
VIYALMLEHGLPEELARLVGLTDEIMVAAEWVCNSYRARNGYTVPLSVNLRSLDDALCRWNGHVAALRLNSDVNGFDRSQRWEGGEHSNEQSNRGPQVHAERWACRPSTGGGQPQDEAEPAAPSQAQRTGSAQSRH